MTTQDFSIKWLAYGLALLPVWFAQSYLLNAYPLWGVRPLLFPLAAMAVATLEGPSAGAGFGMAVGALFDAVVPGEPPGLMTLLFSLLGFGAGNLTRYRLRQDLYGCALCSLAALALVDLCRVLVRLFRGYPLTPMVLLALREVLLSLCFVVLVYPLFLWVFNRVPKATVL